MAINIINQHEGFAILKVIKNINELNLFLNIQKSSKMKFKQNH